MTDEAQNAFIVTLKIPTTTMTDNQKKDCQDLVQDVSLQANAGKTEVEVQPHRTQIFSSVGVPVTLHANTYRSEGSVTIDLMSAEYNNVIADLADKGVNEAAHHNGIKFMFLARP